MKFKLLLGHPTAKGPVFIAWSSIGRYHPLWKGEPLGAYKNIAQAIDDVAGGHTFTPSDGSDLGKLSISGDPGDWVPAAELM